MASNNSPVILFCVVFGIVIFSLFALNINKIKSVLEETHFVESVFSKEPVKPNSTENNVNVAQTNTEPEKQIEFTIRDYPDDDFELPLSFSDQPASPITLQQADAQQNQDITAVNELTGSEELTIQQNKPTDETVPLQKSQTAKKENSEIQETVQPGTKMSDVSLYFMAIDNAGNLIRKEVKRSIPASASPLTSAINTLIGGTSADEADKGLLSLIPDGTSLLSATVKDKIAYLNFSDDFQWNKYGVEGYFGQLIQIVYTATTYSTVESVQFLIEGQKQDYLGSEGVWIGTPLSRSSFK